MGTKIEWTNETWNPIIGCSKVSDENGWTGRTAWVSYDSPAKPMTWRKPRMVFVCSMSDLFHETSLPAWIDEVMEIIEHCPQHTFQILTKRAARMAEYFSNHPVPNNVWLGVTAENQAAADERIPWLLNTPAKVRFVSVEPMLVPVDLTRIKWARIPVDPTDYDYGAPAPDEMWSMRDALLSRPGDEYNKPLLGIDWVICGGESGPNARPMHPDWARSLRDQCQAAGVPFFFKQHGEWISREQWIASGRSLSDVPNKCYVDAKPIDGDQVYRVGKKAAGHLLDGVEWRQMPEVGE